MAGLSVFEHDAIAVVGVAGNDSHAVIVVDVQFQIFFINLGDLHNSYHSFTVDDSHMERVFQVIIYGIFGNLGRKAGHRALQKVVCG